MEGAKTFAENGLDALDYFPDYVGKICDISDFNFDINGVFDQLTEQPDDIGVSMGCFRKDKACK